MHFDPNLATLIAIIGVLVAITNVIVEVLKKVTWDKIPTNLLAVILSLMLTLVVFFAWASYNGITVIWYMVAAAIVVGFMVAYAAMFGFDKLHGILTNLKKLNNY